MPTAVISSPRWRFLQERALLAGGTPSDQLNALIDEAMNPAEKPVPVEMPKRPMTPAERMAHARSFKKGPQPT